MGKEAGTASATRPLPYPPKSKANLCLQEWTDSNTIHSTAQVEVEIGISETYFRTCFGLFQQLWTLILQKGDLVSRSQRKTAKESLSRLVLWIDTLKPGQFDCILEKSEGLRENVFGPHNEYRETFD